MKKTKGISLIVLIVTIIVMIIIAGAVILTLSESNVIDQAEQAVQKHNEANEKDMLVLAWGEYMTASVNNPSANLQVQGATVAKEATDGWRVTFTSGNTYLVSSKGQITTTGKQEMPVVDDEKVVEILEALYSGNKDIEVGMAELKQELNITTDSNNMLDFAILINTVTDPNGDTGLIYFYSLDRIYLVNLDTKEVIYITEATNPVDYEYARKVKLVEEQIEGYIIGKTYTQLIEELNQNVLDSNVLSRGNNIKEIRFYESKGELELADIVIEISTGTYDIGGYVDGIYFENDVCIGFDFASGN